ncbi:ATP-binding protein [Streptomyces sp. NPDC057253]|uniref:sensor histidine kinase n=1 Tax=Streptomyces sp. NPDC057253 TaxID=3346069 RepID=UPI00362CECC6
MSHLRAPAARADRREGGRHGRQVARPAPSLPETHIRPQLLRLAVLPPIAVALSGCAAVLFTVRSTGARPGLVLWCVLGGAVSVTLAGILIAAVAADRAASTVSDRVGDLRRSSARREADLRALVEGLRRGEVPPGRAPRSGPSDDADDFELLAADLARAHDGAVTAVVQAAQLSSQAGSEQKLEVFVNLARRLQSLVHREISILDELENEIEDPDLLKGLFHVDHLATRIRRHAENLAVLGGAVSRRQWSNPVSMTEVLRSAIAEVEQYSRVKLVPPIDGTLRGHAVADVIHLLAELVENATVFSAPHTQVLLRANLVTSGLAVEVEDRGLGMPVAEQHRMNTLLTDPDQVNVASLLADGRIGLFVVSQLAKRHGIHVRLQTNIYGGVQAVLVVPQVLLGSAPGALGAQSPEGAGTAAVSGIGVPPRSPGQLRPGHEARHRGAPAELRPGGEPGRREAGGGAATNRNGHVTPMARGGGAGAQGAGSAVNGRGAAAEAEAGSEGGGPGRGGGPSSGGGRGAGGDGRASGIGGRGSGGSGRAADAGGRGGGVAGGVGAPAGGTDGGGAAALGDQRTSLGGDAGVSHGGGLSSGGSDALSSGGSSLNGGSGALAGGAVLKQGRFTSEGGGSGTDGIGSAAGGSGAGPNGIEPGAVSNRGVADGSWQSPGGNGVVPGGVASSAGGNGVVSGGVAPSAGGNGVVSGGVAPSAGGNGVVPDGGASSTGGNAVGANGAGLSAGDYAVGADKAGSSGGGGAVDAGRTGPSAGRDRAGQGARSGRPAPLPVRGARGGRPNPAEAVPGIRPGDRPLVAEHVVAPPTPRTGTVRGTMGKPQLPRRRAQEHIVPQLRGGPAPRQDPEYLAGHDPGLMAAFQRGISLAEAQQHLESAPGESGPAVPVASTHTESEHTGRSVPGHMGPEHTLSSHSLDSSPVGPAHTSSGHTMEAGLPSSAHTASTHSESGPVGSAHTAPGHMESGPVGLAYTTSASLESRPVPAPDPSAAFDFDFGHGTGRTDAAAPTTGSASADVTPMERPHISDRTTPRHDGSAPAG